MRYRVAIIGTGARPESAGRDGFAMGYRHAPGYERLDSCDLVACADIEPAHASAFADRFGLEQAFTDHNRLLREVEPDIVSICVPPAAHASLVTDCAKADSVRAIHCEKPMATTWGDCRSMVEICDQHDVQLTIDHQRRLSVPVQEAKRLIDEGAIGSLRRLEWSEANLFDAGSHLFDLCDHLTDGAEPKWALAGVATDPDNRWFGAVNDRQGIATWGYSDGTVGLASTGEDGFPTAIDPYLRIVGDQGTIEIEPDAGPALRIERGSGWEPIDTGGETVYRPPVRKSTVAINRVLDAIPGVTASIGDPPTHYERAISHLVTCLDTETEPCFSGRQVLRGTELIFACYESARRSDRVNLPLEIEDNPLHELVSEGSAPGVAD